jgi:5-oxopent-3-ene-1,2,5-tricarboxylate decarboxylase/2-hydroxyhepta-2,4-diene-1,7-dioate isomerase
MVLSPRDSTAHAMPLSVRVPGGLVYGVLLNVAADLERLGEALLAPPYKAPPRAPILYIKPANTYSAHGASVSLPAGADRITVGATIGLVIGSTASRLAPDNALAVVTGMMLVLDLSLPHDSLHRPAIREQCFDGACPLGPMIIPLAALPEPASLVVLTKVDGVTCGETRFDGLVRPIPQLLADVSAFLTLHPGDVLLAGMPLALPEAGPGQRIGAEADGLGKLEVRLVDGGAP